MSHPRLSRRDILRGTLGLGALALLGGPAGARTLGAAGAGVRAGRIAADAEPLSIVRVWPRGDRQIAALAGLDDTHMAFADGSREYLLWPGDRARLDAVGAEYVVTTPDLLADRRVPAGASTVAVQPGQRTNGYRHLKDVEDDLRKLAKDHPDKARVFVLPERSLEGRQVLGLEIAYPIGVNDGRPTALLDGAHHAREWPSVELPMMFAYDLLENYGTDARVTKIVDTQRTLIVPVVNVDGFHYTRTAVVQADTSTPPGGSNGDAVGVPFALSVAGEQAYWRKNRRSFTGVTTPTGSNPDAYGTDPNRNYAYFWGGSGSSATQTDQTHRGSAPYAEPEARNIAGLVLSSNITSMITNHTFGKLCMRPWGAVPDESPDNELQESVSALMVASNGYANILARQLYNTAGTSRDWAYAAVSTLIWTFEHGVEFHGPYDSTIPAMYAINREPYLLMCELAGSPSAHAVVTGRVVDSAGNPLRATVRTVKAFETLTAAGVGIPEKLDAAFDVGEDGAFAIHMNPTTRPTPAIDEGVVESVDIVVSVPGRAPVTVPVILGRGETADLGTITL